MSTLSCRVVVSVWVVCLFCFYRKNVVPRCPSRDVASRNAFMGSEINGRGAFPLWEPSWHTDSFSLPVLTFLSSVTTPGPSWFLVLSSSFSGWPPLLIPWTPELKRCLSWVTVGCENSSSLLRMELGACREDTLFYLPDWRASCHREWRLILGAERQLYK